MTEGCPPIIGPYQPLWNGVCDDYPGASVIIISASDEIAKAIGVRISADNNKELLETVQELPGFGGMIYAMRNKQHCDVVKIGYTRKNAVDRMLRSPWRKSLGYTSKKDRIEEMVLACINVPAKKVEKLLHRVLGKPVTELGWGKEWFRATATEVIEALQDIKFGHRGDGWLCHHTHFKADVRLRHMLFNYEPRSEEGSFAGIGEIDHSFWRPDGYDVLSSIWCSVRYWKGLSEWPVPFFALPEGMYTQAEPQLKKELLEFDVDSFAMVPDLILDEGRLISLCDRQRIHSAKHIGSTSGYIIIPPDITRCEWELDGEIYRIDFLVEVKVREFYRFDSEGQLYRAGCEQILWSVGQGVHSQKDYLRAKRLF